MCKNAANRCRMMIIGDKNAAERVYARVCQSSELNMELKYICADSKIAAWERAAAEVDAIVLCPEISQSDRVMAVQYCREHGKQVFLAPTIFDVLCNGAVLDRVDDIPMLHLRSLRLNTGTEVVKRVFDVVLASVGFICAMPLMIVAALAIKINDAGPIFYSQIRVGKNGKLFKVYKFRSMTVDAEKHSGPVLASENDPRITKIGKFFRTTRIDELPQIWNVLVGEMSIVGPRPERPFFVERLKKEIPEYAYRHNVKPGITGLAQVCGKYNTTPYDKLVYDLLYIQRCGLWQDLVIVLKTVRVLFRKSATEGVGVAKGKVDLEKFMIGRA